jgi:TRAP transporter TAXI family solute receptor
MRGINQLCLQYLFFFFWLLATCVAGKHVLAQQQEALVQQQSALSARSTGSEDNEKRTANSNTVMIMASGSTSIFTRFAEEMQQILDDKKDNSLRILPVLGNSGEQNMLDLLYLKDVDMGIMDDNILSYFKQINPAKYKNIDDRIRFIAKLFDAELHIIARDEVKSIYDLRGKKVNFYQPKSSTSIMAEHLFRILEIDVIPAYYYQDVANQMLKSGEIAAVVRANGAPIPFVQQFKKADGLHFLAIDPSLKNYAQLLELYSPAYLKHEQYPELVPEGQRIPTIANAAVLATYAWPENSERYRRVANFVNKFFDNIDKFMIEPQHPKWRDINLAANITGWKRFKAADDWLNSHKAAATASPSNVREAFEKFLQSYRKANPDRHFDEEQIQALATQFFQWRDMQKAAPAGR